MNAHFFHFLLLKYLYLLLIKNKMNVKLMNIDYFCAR